MNSNLCLILSVIFVAGAYGQSCADSSTNCANMKNNGFCNSTFYTEAQKSQYCANTCGLCNGASSTVAGSTDASTVASSAASSVASSTVSSAATTGSSGTCVDTASACSSWVKNGFCTSTFYSTETKKANCQKSCNLC